MSVGPVKRRPAGSLKAAVADLVTAAGGLEAVAAATRVGRSQIQRYTDHDDLERQMPVDVVIVTEALARQPIVTRYLAERAGCVLLAVEAAALNGSIWDELRELGPAVGQVFADAMAAAADGCLDDAEKLQLLEDLDRIGRLAHQARRELLRDG